MEQNSTKYLERGYIILPKALLKKQLESRKSHPGEFEAILIILMHVNYSNTSYNVNGRVICCHRGEAVYNYTQWGKMLGWTRTKVARFLRRLNRDGVIEFIPNMEDVLHIRIVDYDLWMGQELLLKTSGRKQAEEEFKVFWEKYHEKMHIRRRSIGRALREWMKLTDEERKLATDGIQKFYYSQEDVRFIPQASTYLADKAFFNEYNY